ncbi:IPExxxVDY family protein [Chryseobacterium suipulveris]|uniref:IPExxxVDY family protein n=1 Tax=Chryseobacterium suipulveris TaxID=2929800 RepID=A0ABY4BNL0_9FLAO|nr:IPExxxVDY family protein [Chryseobacterium suipulveris]UOE40760.1 IPExxxVDY family protein [Chryseobacterium suipulveris]
MKAKKLLLDLEEEDEEITIGLLRLAKELPDYEFFYHLNSCNSFKFSRIEDFVYHGEYYDYFFPRFEAYYSDSQLCIHCIANKSAQSTQKKISTELFTAEQESFFLLDHFQEVDYVIKTSEPFDDFSLILFPGNLTFPVQHFDLSSEEELYQLFQYYE